VARFGSSPGRLHAPLGNVLATNFGERQLREIHHPA
jgi:hypothetical protein